MVVIAGKTNKHIPRRDFSCTSDVLKPRQMTNNANLMCDWSEILSGVRDVFSFISVIIIRISYLHGDRIDLN